MSTETAAAQAHAGPDYASGPHPGWLDVDWSQHLRELRIDGRRVNVLDAGEGEPILFVHGHSACWQHWLEQLPRFMAANRVIAVDLPGFGRSEMPEEVSMPAYGRALDRVCDELGVDAACVVGSSMGGFAAAELAISFPQRVERLVLIGAAGMSGRYVGLPTELIRNPGGVALGRVLFGLGGVPDAQARGLARRPRGRKLALGWVCTRAELLHPALVYEILSGAGGPAAAPAAVALASYDFRDRVPDIACPTLIVWGDRDHLVPVACADLYADTIPDSRAVIYAGTGHLPMIERPARFNADLAAFLAE